MKQESGDPAQRFMAAWDRKQRFVAEGPDGRFSAPWAAWEHADSVYLAGRTIGGFFKVSLHPQGGYRLAFTKQFHPIVKDRTAAFQTRDLAVWPRPDQTDAMAVLAASVCFPTDFMHGGFPPASPGKPYLRLCAQEPKSAVHLGFFFSRRPHQELEPHFLERGITPFIHWALNDGTGIAMAAWTSPFDRSVLPRRGPASAVPLTASGRIGPEHGGSNLTMLMWNEPGPGVPLQLIELGGITLNINQPLD